MGLGLTNLELKPITIISAVSIWYFISFSKKKPIFCALLGLTIHNGNGSKQ